MPTGPELPAGVRRLFRPRRPNHLADVTEELRFHLDELTAELRAAGATPEAARAEAERRFGDVGRLTSTLIEMSGEQERTMRRNEWFRDAMADFRFAVRQLARAPGFAAIALLTLGLGIGGTSAIFSIVYTVLLRPLPYQSADRLVDVRQTVGRESALRAVTFGSFHEWQARARSFEALGGMIRNAATLTGVGDPLRLEGRKASAGYWRALGTPPALGRWYGDAADQLRGPASVVISWPLWQSTFNGDSGVIGRSVLLDGLPHTVVAVAPRAYSFTPESPAYWVPLAPSQEQDADFGDHELSVTGRLRPGVTMEDADRELRGIERQLASEHAPASGTGSANAGVAIVPLRDKVLGNARHQLYLIMGAVVIVLLIACGNVTNLLLARAESRRGEIGVRLALGAGSGRILAQLLVESVTLSLAGAAIGMALAAGAIRIAVGRMPPGMPRVADARLDWRVVAFSAALAVVCGVLAGLAPALGAARTDLQRTLRESGRESRGGLRGGMRNALVVGEIAIALMLLTGAGLMLRTGLSLRHVVPGFATSGRVIASIGLPESGYATIPAMVAGYQRVLDGVRTVPGVRSAALVSRVPIAGFGADCSVRPAGTAEGTREFGASFRSASPGFLKTIGMTLQEGRDFTAEDAAGAPPVVIINRRLARELFGSANPIGQQLVHCIADRARGGEPPAREVVGVIGDARTSGLMDDVSDEVYYPMGQYAEQTSTLVVESDEPAGALVPAIRRAVSRVDADLPLSNVATMEDVVQSSTASLRFTTALFVALGATGLVLAMIGVYGVIAFLVGQRTHELGIRMALGADAGRVRGLVLRQALLLGVAGVVIGEAAALMASKALEAYVYGVSVRDPVTFVGTGLVLAFTAVAAALPGARRATGIDPIEVLRG